MCSYGKDIGDGSEQLERSAPDGAVDASACLCEVEPVAWLKADPRDVRSEGRPALSALGRRLEADEHRQTEVDQRRLAFDAAGRRVALVI